MKYFLYGAIALLLSYNPSLFAVPVERDGELREYLEDEERDSGGALEVEGVAQFFRGDDATDVGRAPAVLNRSVDHPSGDQVEVYLAHEEEWIDSLESDPGADED